MGSKSRFVLALVLCAVLSGGNALAAPPATKPPPARAPKPSPKNASRGTSKAGPTKVVRTTEMATRRIISGGPTYDDAALGADTPELRELAAAERELFPPSQRDLSAPWPQELPFPVAATEDEPRVHASGLPPPPPPSTPPTISESGHDLSWLANLEMPDLPVRWDPRVVRYLEFFKNDPRGRATFTLWHKRSGRYIAAIKKTLRRKSLPEDLTALAMIESGFDPTARSPVGALGLWQFMPHTGRIYGLVQDRWADQRMNVMLATEAAADHLADLHRRFGSWELAMAAYNLGYGGVLQAVRRYNTNDYWALCKLEGSLPWETTLYVPKIIAVAIVARNLSAFGFQDVVPEPPLEGEEILVAPGTALSTVAKACGTTTKEVEMLNPELRASRTPPVQEDWAVKVPLGKAASCSTNLARVRKEQPAVERYVVRFGESLEQIAQARNVTVAKLVELNGISQGEVVRGGTVLLVPKTETATADKHADPQDGKKTGDKPLIVVPPDVFVYPDRRRVFYRVQVQDTIKDICAAFNVSPDELRRWNDIDPTARLVENMTLQIFVPKDADLSGVVALEDKDVHTIVAGTEEFFRHWEDKGRRRVVVTAKAGETLKEIGKRYGVSSSLMERINRRGRNEVLSDGERIVVWAEGPKTTAPPDTEETATLLRNLPMPEATPPLEEPPAPDRLPGLR
jgi:membrane-bound lytic murein transglycosylase D